jgi:hypothetical protein
MKYIQAICILAILLAGMSLATASMSSDEQLSLVAQECFKMGTLAGMMQAGETFAQESPIGRAYYNRVVPVVNGVAKAHNKMMLQLFAGDAKALSALLMGPYEYL